MNSFCQSLFIWCCSFGNVFIIKLLFSNMKIDSFSVFQGKNKAIEYGHLHMLIHLSLVYQFICYKDMFIYACGLGQKDIVKWIYENHRENLSDSVLSISLEHAIKENQFEIATWLVQLKSPMTMFELLKITECDVDTLFRHVCSMGELQLAQMLYDSSDPSLDITKRNHAAFSFSCHFGHLEVAQWLVSLKPLNYFILGYDNKRVNFIISKLAIHPEKKSAQKQVEICFICQERNNQLETACNHSFCEPCISSWIINQKEECPYCRSNLKNALYHRIV